MGSILFHGQRYAVDRGKSVLDVLVGADCDIAHPGNQGIYQSCVMQAMSGEVPTQAQSELKPTQRMQNYFLACQWQPSDDIEIARTTDADMFRHALVHQVEKVNASLCRVRLTPPKDLHYHPGQFINLRRPDGVVRSYSLASVPALDGYLELHVRKMQNGIMSNWIHNQLQAGDVIDFQPPCGSFFYLRGDASQDILLIGTGVGLAPLWGIARDALHRGHFGRIWLYHGEREGAQIYLGNELESLARQYSNFSFVFTVSGDNAVSGLARGRPDDLAFSQHKHLKNWRVYLSGAPSMVNATCKRALLAGASMHQIFENPFEIGEFPQKLRA